MAKDRNPIKYFLIERFNFNPDLAETIVEELVEFIIETVITKGEITVPGIGKLYIRSSKIAHSGLRVAFKPARKLKDAL